MVSVGVHLALFFAIATGAQALPPQEPLSPLRFVGQTFEVDATGSSASQAPAAAPSDVSLPQVLEAQPEEKAALPDTALPDVGPTELLPAELSPDENDGAPEDSPPQDSPPQDSPPQDEATSPTKPQEPEDPTAGKPASATPKKNTDPFDMALPGQDSSAAPEGAPGAYGAEGEARAAIDVFRAFLHQFPEACRHNQVWKNLPPGPAGRIEFTLTIGEGSKLLLIDIEEDEDAPAPSHLIQSVLLTRKFLRHQPLMWNDEQRTGSQRLALTATVARRPANKETPDAAGLFKYGLHGESRPTGAFFTYYSGQHIEIELWRLP
jgi:hypothetical protein